jgi:hypothetical protein
MAHLQCRSDPQTAFGRGTFHSRCRIPLDRNSREGIWREDCQERCWSELKQNYFFLSSSHHNTFMPSYSLYPFSENISYFIIHPFFAPSLPRVIIMRNNKILPPIHFYTHFLSFFLSFLPTTSYILQPS